jgi:subtilisin family serine protease
MSNAGAEVTIYVLDTGVNINHVEFEDRASILGGATETDLSKYTGVTDNPKVQPANFPTANTNVRE